MTKIKIVDKHKANKNIEWKPFDVFKVKRDGEDIFGMIVPIGIDDDVVCIPSDYPGYIRNFAFKAVAIQPDPTSFGTSSQYQETPSGVIAFVEHRYGKAEKTKATITIEK